MRFFILCIFVTSNVSNNGKASLDSFLPSSNNLLADTTKNSDKSCNRPCKFNVKPRQCLYDFEIRPSFDEDGKPALTINGMIPGPPIHVCLNDIVIVNVKNKVPNQDLSIHWHGIEQKGTPYMDGVPMVTQCPISYGSTYEYGFIASSPGTFFYHSDSVMHQSDGVYGTLIVDQPQPLEPLASLYDYDRSYEHSLIVGAKFPDLLTAKLEDVSQIKPDTLLINGEEDNTKIFVMPDYAYRLRLINAIALECPLLIQAQKHVMTVIATDAQPVQPVATTAVKLYPGERMDVVIRTDQQSGGYWIRVAGEGPCEGTAAHAMFLYSGFNYTSMIDRGLNSESDFEVPKEFLYGQLLRSLNRPQSAEVSTSYYLAIDRHYPKFRDNDIDFRYISDALPKKPYFPTALSSEHGAVQINDKNFLYPNAPYLLKPREVREDVICKVGEEEKNNQPQCTQILKAEPNKAVELVLINEGYGSNDSYTFHMHGHKMEVITTWKNPEELPIFKKDITKLIRDGLLPRNERNPPMKDTVLVPNKGVTIVRVSPLGGSWLLECRSCSFSIPAAILINVPLNIPKIIIDKSSSCGSFRPADVLLN